MAEGLKFSLVLKEVPVSLTDAHGVPQEYVLRELDGAGRDSYLQNLGSRTRLTPDGKSAGIKDFNGLYACLLAKCLFQKSTNAAVTVEEVQKWPAKVQKALFDKARELSGLDDESEEQQKNS